MSKDKKGNPFTTLGELLEDLFTAHIDNSRLDSIIEQNKQILAQNGEILEWQRKLIGGQATAKDAMGVLQEDVLSMKAFFQIPDARIGATQDEINALGEKLKQETAEVQQFDSTIPPAAS